MSKKEQLKEVSVSSEVEIQYYQKVFANFVSDDDVQIQEDMFVGFIKERKNMLEIVLSNVCYPAQHFHSNTGEVSIEVVFKMGKEWKTCLFDLSLGKNNLMKVLNKYGFLLIDNTEIAQQLFIRHFYNLLNFLLNNTEPSQLVNQVGWTSDECNAFVYGTKIIKSKYNAKEKINEISYERCVLNDKIKDLDNTLKPKGSEEAFKGVINNFLAKPFYKQHCVYLLGVSSPLLQMFGQNGTLITVHSDKSGFLKSIVQYFIHLTYFNEAKLSNVATDNGIMEQLRKNKNFALMIEEFSILINEAPEKAQGLAYKIPGGISKLKNSDTGKNADQDKFHCSMIGSTNKSEYTVIPNNSEAELVRVLEIDLSRDNRDEEYQRNMDECYQDFIRIARFNGGHGLKLIKGIMSVSDIQSHYKKHYDYFIKVYGDTKHRYTCSNVATAYLMAEIMFKMGYNFDLDKIKETFKEIIKYNLDMQSQKTLSFEGLVENVLQNLKVAYLTKHKDNSITFDKEMSNSTSEDYNCFVLDKKELVIPKELFEQKLLSGTKLKPAIIPATFKQIQQTLGDKGLVSQRRFKGAKTNCLVIDLGNMITTRLVSVKSPDAEDDYNSDEEDIKKVFG